ncbi:hypothetical protein BH11PLA1_BH11PLA1_20890 [soil metagenome]
MPQRPLLTIAVLLAAALTLTSLLTTLPSCNRTPPAPAAPTSPPSASYTIRGQVISIPIPGQRTSEFRVKHEAIDDFKDKDGVLVGMSSMIMEFPPAPGVSLADLAVGDKVSLTFSIWWGQSPPWLATEITKLPADTALEFRAKRTPPGSAAPAAPAPSAPPSNP